MRVSPALLACCSLVAIASLPGQAAESAQTTATSVSETRLPEADLEADPVTATELGAEFSSSEASLGRLLGSVSQPAAPRLLTQANPAPLDPGNPVLPNPPADPDPEPDVELPIGDPVEDVIINDQTDTENQPGSIEIQVDDELRDEGDIDVEVEEGEVEEGEVETEDAEDSDPAALPVPSAPTNTTPSISTPDTPAPTATPDSSAEPGETPTAAPNQEATEPEETRVQVAEVDVVSTGAELPPNLVDEVYRAVDTVPGRTTTRSQLQEDINSVFRTGFFSNVRAEPEDTPLGVKVTFFVEPNPVLTNVDVRNTQVLPDEVVTEIFSPQYGKILNLRDFQNSVLDLNDWYQENGYVLAQVTAAPQISDDGTVTLIVAEGEIESIDVRYIDTEGEVTDEDGDPIRGKTKPYIVTREFETEPGDVFQESAIQEDIARVFGLGIFDDIRLSLDPGDEDPRKVKLVVNIAERQTGSVGASLGFNLRGDLFGQLSYNQDNFRGRNQKLRAEGRVSLEGDFLFDVGFTDPWIKGDPYRTSYTASIFNRRSTSLIFDGGDVDVDLPEDDDIPLPSGEDNNGDTPRINRLGTGISFSRPLDDGLSLSLGLQYERIAVLDSDGDVSPRDRLGNLLTASDSGRDDLLAVQFSGVLDRRNDPVTPTSGSLIRLGTEQTIPVGNGSIFYNKLRGSYSQYVPVNLFKGREKDGETLAFNFQGGTILGDLPPYEAFPLGGGNSIRGYEEGAVGAGRSFVLATAEYRFPLFSEFLNGALFMDYGSDLGTGDSVPGNPAGVRGKPGSGFGYGAGVRVRTPLGALRLDYGLSEEGSRFHFGFGERF